MQGCHRRHPAIIHAGHDAFLTQNGFHCGHVFEGQGYAPVEGGVGSEFQLVKEDRVIAIPADQQRLGCPAGRRPAFEEWVEIGLGINPQSENAQRLAGVSPIENGHQQRQIDLLVMLVPVKIMEGHLTRPQDFWNAP